MHSQFFQVFLEIGPTVWGSLFVSILPYSPCLLPATHSCAYAVLSCAYQQELQQGFFSSAALCDLASLLWPHLFLSCGVLISTVLVYYQQSLLESTAIPVSVSETSYSQKEETNIPVCLCLGIGCSARLWTVVFRVIRGWASVCISPL